MSFAALLILLGLAPPNWPSNCLLPAVTVAPDCEEAGIMFKLTRDISFSFRQGGKTPALFLGITLAFPLCAQAPLADEVARAAALNDQGRFTESMQTITSFFAQERQTEDALAGIAWDLRGVALQNLEDWEGARRSYETAIAILRTKPDQIQQYASALDNLGSLKADMGQLQESRSLRTRARQLFQSVHDHAGTARASINLALVALALRDRKHARQFLADASREESLVPNPGSSDLAALNTAQAIQWARDGRLNDALDAINHAIGLWTDHYGPRYYLLVTGLALRGQIDNQLHKTDDSLADFRRSLDILKTNGVADSQVFFIVESEYATALRDSGEREEAERLESEAKEGIERLKRQQCSECSISAESFR
jgi:tetratricopeptide (TPR) repeat protein